MTPYGNTAEILERAIANGCDVNIPSVGTDWDNDGDEIKISLTTLELFFFKIDLSDIDEENSKKLSFLLFNHSALSKDIIDKIIEYFKKSAIWYTSDHETGFLKYLNSVYEKHPNCLPFFSENYLEEIQVNHYINLLPQAAKDIFVF